MSTRPTGRSLASITCWGFSPVSAAGAFGSWARPEIETIESGTLTMTAWKKVTIPLALLRVRHRPAGWVAISRLHVIQPLDLGRSGTRGAFLNEWTVRRHRHDSVRPATRGPVQLSERDDRKYEGRSGVNGPPFSAPRQPLPSRQNTTASFGYIQVNEPLQVSHRGNAEFAEFVFFSAALRVSAVNSRAVSPKLPQPGT